MVTHALHHGHRAGISNGETLAGPAAAAPAPDVAVSPSDTSVLQIADGSRHAVENLLQIVRTSNFDSLRRTQSAYYERFRFADVFAWMYLAAAVLPMLRGAVARAARRSGLARRIPKGITRWS